ncbi:MAG: translation elongation factor Ts [Candidatus Parcubacteria bacterium]|nr:translation elongation factor Ts [Candidatus Parcubacteria bacterium]
MISAADVSKLREATQASVMDCKKALEETEGNFDKALEVIKREGLLKADKKSGRTTEAGNIEAKLNEDSTRGALLELRSNTSFVSQSEEFRTLTQNLVEQVLVNGNIDITPEKLLAMPFLKDSSTTVADVLKVNIAKFGENIEIGNCAYMETQEGLVEAYIHNGGRVGVLLSLETDKKEIVKTEEFNNLAHDLAMHIAAMNPMYISQENVPANILEDKKAAITKELVEANKPQDLLEKIATGKLNDWKKEICLLDQIYIKDPSLKIMDWFAKEAEKNGKISVSKFIRFQA